jgi:hypothetical protein
VHALACVYDFAYNVANGTYGAIDVAINELSSVACSDYLDLGAPVAAAIDIVATFPGTPTISTDASVLHRWREDSLPF